MHAVAQTMVQQEAEDAALALLNLRAIGMPHIWRSQTLFPPLRKGVGKAGRR